MGGMAGISKKCLAKPIRKNGRCVVYERPLEDCCWLCSRWPKRFEKAQEIMGNNPNRGDKNVRPPCSQMGHKPRLI